MLSQDFGLDLSPASIRNVMADLEANGLLMQPHTSAGRVPTDKGYRYWVDCLMEPEELAENDKELIWNELQRERTIEGLAEKVSKVISELTENAALIYLKNLKRASFLSQLIDELVAGRKIEEFLEEEPELFIDGAFRMLGHPEFQDLEKMRLLLRAFDEKDAFLEILVADINFEGIHVHIGSENVAGHLGNVSLVVKDCYFGNLPIGGVAVVGPTRMRYSKVVSVVSFVADSLTDAMKKF